MFLTYSLFAWMVDMVFSHGRLMDPPARNSMWRFGFNNPVNYNDNELYCGGKMVSFSFLFFFSEFIDFFFTMAFTQQLGQKNSGDTLNHRYCLLPRHENLIVNFA